MKNLLDKVWTGCRLISMFKNTEAMYILKHSQLIMIFILVVISIVIARSVSIVEEHAEKTLTEIGRGYGDYVDKDYYCKSVNCRYIYQPTIVNPTIGTMYDIVTSDVEIINNTPTFIMDGFDIYLPVAHNEDMYYVDTGGYFYKLLLYVAVIYLMFILFIIHMIHGVMAIERNECLSSLHDKESDLQHNILFNITANINHEVNSPLLVIKSVINEFKYELKLLEKELSRCTGRRTCEPINDFKTGMKELLDLSAESVTAIESAISPLSDYKSIKFTNGDRSVYMLIDIATKMLRRTSISTFNNIYIDEEFHKYSISHENEMSNGFFLNLMINHIKNSLEAGSTRLILRLIKRDSKFLYIHIVDNGSGIAPDMVDKIYQANVTTKANITEYRRGVGLYLSKLLISKKYNGDDTFVSSVPGEKTIFCVKVMYEKFKYYKKDECDETYTL